MEKGIGAKGSPSRMRRHLLRQEAQHLDWKLGRGDVWIKSEAVSRHAPSLTQPPPFRLSVGEGAGLVDRFIPRGCRTLLPTPNNPKRDGGDLPTGWREVGSGGD